MTAVVFLGLGAVGYPIAGYLQREGYHVCVRNRLSVRALRWVEKYVGRYADTPHEACTDVELVFCCAGNGDDLRAVALGEQGAFAGMTPGSLFIDHTTVSAEVTRRLPLLAAEHELGFLDAPVSGGQAGAVDGTLAVMVGGEEVFYRRAEPLLHSYTRMVRRMGDVGSGQLTKMINQICITELLQGLAGALHFAQCASLDGEAAMQVIGKGAAQSRQLGNRHQSMLAREFDFSLVVGWMRKDLSILLAEVRRNSAQLPVVALVDQFCAEVQAMGSGRWDTSSLIARLRSRHDSGAEDEVHRAGQTRAGPEVIQLRRLLREADAERDEDRQGDDFLHDLQLANREFSVADAVSRRLQQVFEQHDTPAGQGGDDPRLAVEGLQVATPDGGHEQVGTG